jgi:hypothetical protein
METNEISLGLFRVDWLSGVYHGRHIMQVWNARRVEDAKRWNKTLAVRFSDYVDLDGKKVLVEDKGGGKH